MRSPSEVAHIIYASIIATELGFCSHPMISMHVACMIETCFTIGPCRPGHARALPGLFRSIAYSYHKARREDARRTPRPA